MDDVGDGGGEGESIEAEFAAEWPAAADPPLADLRMLGGQQNGSAARTK